MLTAAFQKILSLQRMLLYLPCYARSKTTQTGEMKYYIWGATICEVDFDVLTGENQLTRTDIQFDCGQR